ncbi:MAG: hypothetical protein RR051_00040 [Clostridiales bacterium]
MTDFDDRDKQVNHTNPDEQIQAYPELWEDTPYIEPSLAQWRRLYQATSRIKKQKPWLYLADNDLVTIELPQREEPSFVSIMGKNQKNYGICIYPGFKSFLGCLKMRQAEDGEPSFITHSYQNCFTCVFGNNKDLMPEDKDVLRQLGISFRGDNQWIYFRSNRSGFLPWRLNASQVDLVADIVESLYGVSEDLRQKQIKVDFLAEQVLNRYFEPKDGSWHSRVTQVPPIPMDSLRLTINDQLFIARLKKAKINGTSLELDLVYLPLPYLISPDSVPAYPQICLLADAPNQEIVDQYMLNSEDRGEVVILGMLADYITNNGKPWRISVRDQQMALLLEDFCQKLSIQLIFGKGLPMIDYFAKGLAEFGKRF